MTPLEQELWTLMSEYLAQGKPMDHTYMTDPRRISILERKAAEQADNGPVICLDCGWQGKGYQLAAQACPVCDGRCADC